jgi:hypothetical protein
MKPILIEECACIIGRMYGPGSAWIVREPKTGLRVSNPSSTRKQAIEDAAKQIQAAGGKERFKLASS